MDCRSTVQYRVPVYSIQHQYCFQLRIIPSACIYELLDLVTACSSVANSPSARFCIHLQRPAAPPYAIFTIIVKPSAACCDCRVVAAGHRGLTRQHRFFVHFNTGLIGIQRPQPLAEPLSERLACSSAGVFSRCYCAAYSASLQTRFDPPKTSRGLT